MSVSSAPVAVFPPIAAATLIILREGPAETEVLMLRRHHALNAFGGLWVFPGGKIEAADRTYAAWLEALADSAPVADLFTDVPGGASGMGRHASRVAAIRETFEETGLLYVSATEPDFIQRYQRHREDWRVAVARDADAFEALLEAEQARPDLNALHYWLRMVPPLDVPRRFDTDFYIALAPSGQEPRVDLNESMEARWVPLSESDQPSLDCAPVTRIALLELQLRLQEHRSLQAFEASARGQPCRLLYTRRGVVDGVLTVVFPWDPDYLTLPGDGEPWSPAECERMRSLPSRMPIQDGLFRTDQPSES